MFNDNTNTLTEFHEEQVVVIYRFYSQLYSPDPPHQSAINVLRATDSSRNDRRKVSSNQQDVLLAPIDLEEIIQLSGQASLTSFPGVDRLPYDTLRLFLHHPAVGPLAVTAYNGALNRACFPESWSQSVMTRIPKKDDPSKLTNN